MNDSANTPRRILTAWLGVACLAGAWFLAADFYGRPIEALEYFWVGLALVGTLALSAVPVRIPTPRTAWIAAVLVLPALAVARPEEQFGLLLLAAGLGLTTLTPRIPRLGHFGRGAMLAGALWIFQGLMLFVYSAVTARTALMPEVLAEAVATIARWAGIHVAYDAGNLVLFSMRAKHPVAATWTMLVDPVTVSFLSGGVLLILITAYHRGRALLTFAVVMAAWIMLRSVGMLSYYLHEALRTDYNHALDHARLFWDKKTALAMVFPAALIAWRCIRFAGPAVAPPPPPVDAAALTGSMTQGRPALARALVFGAALILTMAVLWHPSGDRKAGRIIIDESKCVVDDYTKWRWAAKEFDTTSTLR